MVSLVVSSPAWSQSAPVSPESEFQKRIKVSEDIQPLGENPFGENISLYNGALSFEQTDVSATGIGPLLQISREFHLPDVLPTTVYHTFLNNGFVDWSLEVPRLETMSAANGTANLEPADTAPWFFTSNAQRCSSFASGPDMYVTFKSTVIDYMPQQWWHGYQLIIPGAGSQEVLLRDASNTQSPQMTVNGATESFPLVTKQHWSIGCLSQTSNGKPGEGFLAVSPDGTSYWLDALIYKKADPVIFGGGGALYRRVAMMLVSKVVDRFGNTLTFSYDGNGNLTGIQSSDGRQVSLTWESWQNQSKDTFGSYINPVAYRVHSITLQPGSSAPRTWTYSYSSDPYLPRLSSVQQPDGSAWSFNLGGFAPPPSDGYLIDDSNVCAMVPKLQDAVTSSGSMTHPSGLIGTFTVQSTVRGRSYVPYYCPTAGNGNDLRFPNIYKQNSITQKQFSGAGLPTYTWAYNYSGFNYSWTTDCSSGCASTVATDVVDPSGHDVKYTFSNKFDASESMLLETDYYAGGAGTATMRSEVNSYANPTGGPWPTTQGNSPQIAVNQAQAGQLIPVSQRTLQQDGDTYTWLVEAFDAYAHPTKLKRYNSIAGQSAIEEQTSYLNDLPHWVLGLPQETDNLSTGEVESLNTYNLSNVTLQSRARFGQTLMSYTFDGQGQLASFTDGKSHTTTLSNYKRGIPQSIAYPDTYTQSLVVDDFGQISSLTDQAGNTTSYNYDAIGRIAGITYPAGDEVAWSPKNFSYAYITGAERGVAANHWRRTTTKGNAVTTTYFDAMLRPVLSDTAIAGTSGSDISTRTDYDWKGQKIFVTYPVSGAPDLGSITSGSTSVYDALGRLTQTQQASELGTLTAITAYLSGARQQVTDPKGNVTTTSYQVFDQPSYNAVIQVQAPEGITQSIARDLYGNPLTITQSGLYGAESDNVTKSLTYDSYHRLCRTTEPESGSEVTAYDAANNVAWTAAGLAITGTGCGQEQVVVAAQTTRTYDTMNRVLTLLPPAGTQSTTYTYDALGNLATSNSGISASTVIRNKLGQLTSETLSVNGNGANVLRYAHDSNGNLATLSYPDGTVINYAPDALGRPTQVGSYASGISYFPDGDVQHFSYGNGADYLVQKNARQLLSNFTYAKGSTLNLSEDFAYDPNGNITTINDLAGGPRSKVLSYDTLNRLTQAQANGMWGVETYSYDPLNNLRSRVSGGQTYAYNYDATNRLASITNGASTTSSFAYDNRGNVITRNGNTLVFDAKNQLTQMLGFDNYAYDAAGRRVLKTPASGSSPTYYFYTQAGQLLYQVDGATTKTTDYIYLGKKMIARSEGYATSIRGGIDSVNIDASGNAVLSGWACSTGIAQSINVDLYVGGPYGTGTMIGRYSANQSSEPAVATACSVTTGSYRYAIPLATTTRSQYAGKGIYIYGVSPVGNDNLLVSNSGNLVVPAVPAAPAAPASASASVANDLSSISVSWPASTGATSYVLQQKVSGGVWTQVANGSGTSYSLSNPADGSYSYQAQACNANGCSVWTASNTVSVAHIPPTPASITVPATSNGPMAVSWAASNTATYYNLYQSINGGGWTNVYSGPATSAALTVTVSGNYIYYVSAGNANGWSGQLASSSTVVVTIPPASAPSLTVPSSSSTGSYTVSWTTVPGATSYGLAEQANGGTWTSIQSSNATSWSTSGRGNGTYSYGVVACNAGGCGPWSPAASISVALIPTTPTGMTLTTSGPYDKPIVHLSWSASATATTYTVQYKDPQNTLSTFYSGPNTSYQLLMLVNGMVSFRVQACNASGCSDFGPWVGTSLASGG
ncbi:hypothetical protein [Dyella tabacisoli]|nr:hypothetical protein [Dyella tabacisoli]